MKNWLQIIAVILGFNMNAQIANYVSNGGFEEKYSCSPNNASLINAKYWDEIDPDQACKYCNYCYPSIPYNGFGFQYQRTGDAYVITDFICNNCVPTRTYLRNYLKSNLIANQIYCVKFYVNIGNNSSYGIDGFAAYFGDNTLDTISSAHIPLNFLTPQVQNQNGNIITDTLNWTAVTGTFTAMGNEKFMVIGNFKSDAATNKILINPTFTPNIFCTVSVDDVSCIPIDLPAHAGPNVSVVPGNSVYIGRARDVGIDEACTWYKLPIIITPTTPAIDTAAGIWVSPAQTSTYVVRQQIWCGTVKYDTVIVFMNPLGVVSLGGVGNDIKLFPNPANDFLEISVSDPATIKEFKTLTIYDHLGQIVYKEELIFKEKAVKINTSEFLNGIYFFQLKDGNEETVSKRFVVYR